MNEPFPPSPSGEAAASSLEASKQHAIQAAEELRAAAGAKAQQIRQAAEDRASQIRDYAEERGQHFRDAAEQSFRDARERASDWREEGERYVRENPAQAVLAALGVGFVLGLLIRR
jgi:ElaB/YqjD/DUF883 family membrane-anchored ribosome-binding protein